MTENEILTEKRDGQNVIPLRQDGKTKWSLASAGMGGASTQFLYGTHADKLADYEAIGTIEEFKALKERNEPKKPIYKFAYEDGRKFHDCPTCGSYVTHAFEQDQVRYCNCCGQKLDWSEE